MKSHVNPIFQTSSFVFDSPEQGRRLFAGEEKGHIYSRIGNPTVEQFEKMMVALEEGVGAVAFSSGMAAILGCTLPFLKAGDHIVVGDTLYGPSTTLLSGRFEKFGVTASVIDTSHVDTVKAAITAQTKMIFLESPANPTCKISDIPSICKLAHEKNILVAVDATFASPYNMKPIKLGAHMCVHSLTKYINGHGDVVGGVVTCKSEEITKTVRNWRKDTGSILGPFDAWLVMRGIRTLCVRMERHNTNGRIVAEYLRSNPKVSKVMYPGFEDFPNHAVAARDMKGYGATFSFCMKNGFDAAKRLLENCHLCTVAVSLGTPDTLIEHPASMTHASVPEELMKKQGLSRDLIRIHVGLEDPQDIIADLKQAIEKATA